MRLHWMEVCGFGPFADRQSIDFDALTADGLFLLHGDTGAGKTTLLDAVAFALFGSVPGARNEARRLRCDTAAPGTPTEVVLELTVAGQRLRLVRSPEYERPKKRGNGTTRQPAKASLTWLDGRSEPLTRLDEVARTVSRLLGMTAEQFFQVVLLPQGEFARFLRADTADREQLLTTLFGTERFADVERWFRDRRAECGRRLDERRQAVHVLVARVAQAAGEDPPGADADQPADAAWLAGVRQRCAQRARSAAAAEDTARHRTDQAERAVIALRQEAERARRVRAARAALAELAEQQQQRDGWERELAAARAAQPVVPAHAAERAAAQRLAEAERRESAAVDAAAAAGARPVPDGTAAPRERAGSVRERAGELAALVAEAQTQQQDEQSLARLDAELTRLRRRRAIAERDVGELPGRVAEARADTDAARDAGLRAEALAARHDELAAALETARAVPGAEHAMDQARQAHRDAVDAHQQARHALLDVRARRLEGMAAELAAGLTEGSACPVCGGTTHPHPATAVTGAVTEGDEQAAVAAERAAQARRDEAAARWRDAEAHHAALLDRLGGRGEQELAAALRDARAERDANARLAASADEAQRRLREHEAAVESAHRTLDAVGERLGAAEAERRALCERMAEREGRLEQARGTHPDVASRRRHLLRLAITLDALAEARAAVAAAAEQWSEREVALRKAVAEAGFADSAAALSAMRDGEAIERLAELLAEHEQRRIATRAVLDDPELAGTDPDAGDTLPEQEAALARSRDELQAAVSAARAADQRSVDIDRLAGRLSAQWQQLAPAEREYAELDALTDVVNGRGQNARRMSLRSYVLAARLEEVAIAASRRLRAMSHGRYCFVHTDAKGARGTRGGLGLDVLDDYSGQERPAKTLSGGESFLASLSLALGLADVVTAETGAADLDTLFVDEGFGTLDPDTLDEVMTTLDELRAGGRVVGLVSHVTELQQRIPMRLRVCKFRDGSTVELTTWE